MSGELGPHIPHELQVGEITGWRGWHLVSSYEKLRLMSPDMQTVWMPDRVIEAFCSHSYAERINCMCGINAYASRELLESSGRLGHTVIGEIAMYGDVQAYEKGYRSQYAKICALYVKAQSVQAQAVSELSAAYNVPVYLYDYMNGELIYRDKDWSEQFASFERAVQECQLLGKELDYLAPCDELTNSVMALHLWAACTIQENKDLVSIWLTRFDATTTLEAFADILDYAQIDQAREIWVTYSALSYDAKQELCLVIQKLLEAKSLLVS